MLEMFIDQLISKVEKTFKEDEHLLYDSSIGSKYTIMLDLTAGSLRRRRTELTLQNKGKRKI